MEAFPFMWAKNKQISDWCCVAKPDFLRKLPQEARGILLGAQRGVELAPGEIEIVRREYPNVGILDLAYRKVPAEITDRTGAPFDYIEGIVLRNRDPNLVLSAKHFDEARARMQPTYDEFAKADRWGDAEAYHAEKMDIGTLKGEPALKVRETIIKSQTSVAATESVVENAEKSWISCLKPDLSTPKGKGIAIAAGATVIIGGVMLVRHFSQKHPPEQPTAPAR